MLFFRRYCTLYLLHHTTSLRLSRVSRPRECIRWCRSPPGALSRLRSLSAVGAIASLLFAASFILDKVLLSHGQLFRAACSSEAVACNSCVRYCQMICIRIQRYKLSTMQNAYSCCSPDSDIRPRHALISFALILALTHALFPAPYEAWDLFDSPKDVRYPPICLMNPLYMSYIFRILKPLPEIYCYQSLCLINTQN